MTWHRSDLTTLGLGRALTLRTPRLTLSTWGDTWVLTGPTADTRTGLTLGAVLDHLRDYGVGAPTDAELAWVVG